VLRPWQQQLPGGSGQRKGQMVTVDMTAATDLHSVQEFRQLAIKQVGDSIVARRCR
jgi:multidrug efflux pump